MLPPFLTDDEIRQVCEGLVQPAAMERFLLKELGIRVVKRKPNGLPLVGRAAFEAAMGAPTPGEARPRKGPAFEPNRQRLQLLLGGRNR